MEIPASAVTGQRAFAAVLLLAALAAGWVEHGSPLAAKVRTGRPYLFWVEASEDGAAIPRLHLAVYDPARRGLSVLFVPEDARVDGRRTLAKVYAEAHRAAGDPDAAARAAEDLAAAKLAALSPEPADWSSATRMTLPVGAPDEESEPPLRAALALKSRLRSPRVWLALARSAAAGLAAGDRAAADPLLLALELRRSPLERLRPAWLPADELAAPLLGRLLAGEDAAASETAVTAEVLNGAGVDGLASSAAKMLRLKSVDVVTTGASSRPRERTVVYDRVGDFARAEAVRAMLGCREAKVVTRLDPSRAVDVSVELGADCAALGRRDGPDPH
ncbi:MAG: LytR C-terminal domain-containing protein [Elusimicrobiota bacterium]|nr:LytR C-terminal domain-containing protein [Elusimicrobiota bacterium]